MDEEREFIVTFDVWVTAKDAQQAAEFALDDLRDPQILEWTASVSPVSDEEYPKEVKVG